MTHRSTGPGIGAATWAAQDGQGGEPGVTCGQDADADFEQDEQPPDEADFAQVGQCRQPARLTTRNRATIPSRRFAVMRYSLRTGHTTGAELKIVTVTRVLPATRHISTFHARRTVTQLT